MTATFPWANHRTVVDPRLRTAVDASLRWYEDVFAEHGIPNVVEHGLWRALAQPPRWHSVVKTLEPTSRKDHALSAAEPFDHCSVADSFGELDLSDDGFTLLFRATWVHHPRLAAPAGALPRGWSVVDAEEVLEEWNRQHDTVDVLVPSLLGHPRFLFLCERGDGGLIGGAVLHDPGGHAVELSNTWAVADRQLDPGALLACVHSLRPGREVVGYEHGRDLEALLEAGFRALGPQHVWVR